MKSQARDTRAKGNFEFNSHCLLLGKLLIKVDDF